MFELIGKRSRKAKAGSAPVRKRGAKSSARTRHAPARKTNRKGVRRAR